MFNLDEITCFLGKMRTTHPLFIEIAYQTEKLLQKSFFDILSGFQSDKMTALSTK